MIGIIGGSGLYDIPGLAGTRWETVRSPFGEPSDQLLLGELAGVAMAFLPRHGRGHRIPPSEINYRANIDALKRVGVTDLLSVSAVGSLREELPPGRFVLVDQFIDRTVARARSFFGTGLVAHVSMAHPVCDRLGDHLESAGDALTVPVTRGGTYLAMEGPPFSTRAESALYRSWGCDVIGMTNLPEATLAREAELCYAAVAMVTDYDCWHPGHAHVSVDAIVAALHRNVEQSRSLVARVAPRLQQDTRAGDCSCRRALDHAIMTAPEARSPDMLRRLDAVAGRVLTRPAD